MERFVSMQSWPLLSEKAVFPVIANFDTKTINQVSVAAVDRLLPRAARINIITY